MWQMANDLKAPTNMSLLRDFEGNNSQTGSEMNSSGIAGNINTDEMDPVTRDIVLSPEFQEMVDRILKEEVSRFVAENLPPVLQPTAKLYLDEFINTETFKGIIIGTALAKPGFEPCTCPESKRNPPYFKDSQRLPLPPGVRAMNPNGPNACFNDSQGGYSWEAPLPTQTWEEQMQENQMIARGLRRASQDGIEYQRFQEQDIGSLEDYGSFARGINTSVGQSTPPNGPTRNSSGIGQSTLNSTFGIAPDPEQVSPQSPACQQKLNGMEPRRYDARWTIDVPFGTPEAGIQKYRPTTA